MLKRSFMAVTASLTTLLFLGSPAFAESHCKGLSGSECQANSECVWVESYKRQDGSSVEAYCRAKPEGEAKGKRKDKKEKREGKESRKSERSKKERKSKKTEKKKSEKGKSHTSKKEKKDSKKKGEK